MWWDHAESDWIRSAWIEVGQTGWVGLDCWMLLGLGYEGWAGIGKGWDGKRTRKMMDTSRGDGVGYYWMGRARAGSRRCGLMFRVCCA